MCLAYPGRIEKLEGMKAVVDYGSEKRTVIASGDIPVNAGDYVLVQMGCVVQKLSVQEAKASLAAWKVAQKI